GIRTGSLAEEQEFLVPLLLFAGFGRGAHFLNLRASPAGDVLVAGLDDDVALLAQRLEVVAHGRLHPRAVKFLRDFVSDLVERLLALVIMLQHLENEITLLGLQDVRKLVPLHRENFVLEFLRKLAALINAKKAALLLGAAVGVALGNLAKVF